MKKILSLFAIGAIFAFTSCSRDGDSSSVASDEQQVSITVGMSDDLSTRAFQEESEDIESMRLYLLISYNDQVVYNPGAITWDANGSYTFELRLVANQEYVVSAWADFGDNSPYEVVIDETGTVAPKVMISDVDNYVGSKSTNDGFFAISNVTFTKDDVALAMTLTRPFAALIINTTDSSTPSISNGGLTPMTYTMSFDVPTSLDLYTGEVGDVQPISISGDVVSDDVIDEYGRDQLSFDYFFATIKDEATIYDIAQSFYAADQVVTEEIDGEEVETTVSVPVATYEFTNIPLRRNWITYVTGNILTEPSSATVEVSQDWDGELDDYTVTERQ